jgi:hypothetical protein
MPRQPSAEDVLHAFDPIFQLWSDNATFRVGEFDLDAARSLQAKVREISGLVRKVESELSDLIASRDTAASQLNELRTRALSGIRAHFGPDSPEYGRAGGTRKSERQKPGRAAVKQHAQA